MSEKAIRLEQARVTLAYYQKRLDRLQSLLPSGAVSVEEVEEAAWNRDLQALEVKLLEMEPKTKAKAEHSKGGPRR